MKITKLFTPIQINGVEIRNRVAMAPMSTDFGNYDGTLTDTLIEYYTARAKGGVGLMLFEVVTVDPTYPYMPRTVGLWNEDLVLGAKKLTYKIHKYGAKIFPQLSHPGPESLSPIINGTQTIGPVAGCLNNITKMRSGELKIEEIPEIIQKMTITAVNCQKAGFDGIEIHAAHAYMLLGSFISALRNRRTDIYGGSLENRLRFPIEAIQSIRKAVGPRYPITIRISADEFIEGGRNLQGTQLMIKMLEDAGIDGFHISNGVYPNEPYRIIPPTGSPLALNAKFSHEIKKVTTKPVFVVGRINEPLLAESLLQNMDADMVVLGRALIADPDFVNKTFAGQSDQIIPCIGCGLGCVTAREQGHPMTCVLNPTVGRELEMVLTAATRKKQVMVVGGGPAGLTVARVAALRGHNVTLYEKSNTCGGQYRLAAVAPSKTELTKALQYLTWQASKAGVKIQLNTEVTPQLVTQIKPECVVIATGAISSCPNIKCIDGKNVVPAIKVLSGEVEIEPGKILIVGGGMIGLETAELLASNGDNPMIGLFDVTIMEMLDTVGQSMFSEGRTLLMKRLREQGVNILTKTKVLEFFDNGALILRNGKEEVIHGMDKIILAMGMTPYDPLSSALTGKVPELYVIGDAKKTQQVMQAIAEGYEIGRKI